MRFFHSAISLTLAAGLFAGCLSTRKEPLKVPVAAPKIEATPAQGATTTIPVPSVTASSTFQPGDVLYLDIFQEPTLCGEFVIGEDGGFRHPLLGWVRTKGMTPGVAEVMITRLLKDGIMVDPRVTVRIKSTSNRKIVINGQVNRPGEYEFPGNDKMTLLGAIARAGGFTSIAKPSQVRIIRTVNGVKETIPVDVPDLFSGRAADIPLQPEDKIFVPESAF